MNIEKEDYKVFLFFPPGCIVACLGNLSNYSKRKTKELIRFWYSGLLHPLGSAAITERNLIQESALTKSSRRAGGASIRMIS